MSDVLCNLRRHSFPDVLIPAFIQLEKCFTSSQDIKSGYNEEMAEQIVNEFIFQQGSRKGHPRKKLSSLQEICLLEHLVQLFSGKNSGILYQQMFKALFGITNDAYKMRLLSNLLSLAIGVGCSNILNAAALWMQLKGCNSEIVCKICEQLVTDYFVLMEQKSEKMMNLPAISPHFTCNFITCITGIYHPSGAKSRLIIPGKLLIMITDWLSSDCRLCLATLEQNQGYFLQSHRTNLWTSPTKPNTQTPAPGLVTWCVQAPLYHLLAICQLNNSYEHTLDNVSAAKIADLEKLDNIWSKLHLSVLEMIMQLPSIDGANQLELFTIIDMNRILKELSALYSTVKLSSGEHEHLDVAADRMVQILQIALSAGAFRCSLADLRNVLKNMPPSQLTPVLERYHLSSSAPQMHNAC